MCLSNREKLKHWTQRNIPRHSQPRPLRHGPDQIHDRSCPTEVRHVYKTEFRTCSPPRERREEIKEERVLTHTATRPDHVTHRVALVHVLVVQSWIHVSFGSPALRSLTGSWEDAFRVQQPPLLLRDNFNHKKEHTHTHTHTHTHRAED